MSLATLRKKVASFTQKAADEKEQRISSCFPALPTWTDEDKARWMKEVFLKLEDEASKGKTEMVCLVGDEVSSFRHKWMTREEAKEPEYPHGLWRTRDQSTAVDHVSYEGWILEYELPESVPGLFFFLQDSRMNFHQLSWREERDAAEERLQEIQRQVQREFKTYWVAHSDIPITDSVRQDGKGKQNCEFSFDWAGDSFSKLHAESYEVKRAREDVLRYQEKLESAVEQLQSARKRSKITQ